MPKNDFAENRYQRFIVEFIDGNCIEMASKSGSNCVPRRRWTHSTNNLFGIYLVDTFDL